MKCKILVTAVKLVIVPEQADIIRQIYSYAVNQGMGYQKIAWFIVVTVERD